MEGTKVIKWESKSHGSFHYETTDSKGNKHQMNGVIHNLEENAKMVRTFEMENMSFGVQLEIFTFKTVDSHKSRLHKQII